MKIKKSVTINNSNNEALDQLLSFTKFPINLTSIIASHSPIVPKHQAIFIYPLNDNNQKEYPCWEPANFKKIIPAMCYPKNNELLDHGDFNDKYYNIFVSMSDLDPIPIGSYGKWESKEMIILVDISHVFCDFSVIIFKALADIIKELNWKEIKQENKKFPISIGADPEMELVANGIILPANIFFQSNGEIGTDAAGGQLELRPTPSNSGQQLIQKMENLLRKVAQDGYTIETKGDKYPIGCHIHFGTGIQVDQNFIKILDNWLQKPLNFFNGNKRGNYANPTQYEPKSYGFEYRSLPSGFLANKQLSIIIFKLAHTLADKFYNGEEIELNPQVEDYTELLGKKDSDFFFNTIKELKILNLPTYVPMFLASWNLSKQHCIRVSAVSSVEWPHLKNLQFKVSSKKPYFIMLLPSPDGFFVGNTDEFKCLKPGIEKFFISLGYIQAKEKCNISIADLFVGVPDNIRTNKKDFVDLLNIILNKAKEIRENIK